MRDQSMRELAQGASLENLVSRYIYLSQSEENKTNRVGVCPFEVEGSKHSPLIVDTRHNSFYCDTCKQKGGPLEFVAWYRYASPSDAFEILRNVFNLPSVKKVDPITEKLTTLMSRAVKIYHTHLLDTSKNTSSALKYLESRGFKGVTPISWQIGYAPLNDRAFLFNKLTREGFTPDEIEAAGLTYLSEKGSGEWVDRFRGRIVVPIFDLCDKPVGFTGRVFPEEESPKAVKYLNSPTTAIYTKSKILFGLNRAAPRIKQLGRGILMEGAFDVILAHQSGQDTAISHCALNLSEEQIKLLNARFPRAQWNLMLDADSAGNDGAMRFARSYLGHLDARVVSLPEGKDPADLVKAGQSFDSYLRRAVPLFDFYWDSLTSKLSIGTLEEKAGLLEELKPAFARIPRSKRGLYLDEIASRLSLSPESLDYFFSPNKPKNRLNFSPRWEAEAEFARGLLRHQRDKSILTYFFGVLEVTPNDFSMEEVRAVVQSLSCGEVLMGHLTFAGTFFEDGEQISKIMSREGVIPNKERLDYLFNPESRNKVPTVSDLERAYVKVLSYKVPGKINYLLERGEKPYNLIKRVQESLKDG